MLLRALRYVLAVILSAVFLVFISYPLLAVIGREKRSDG